MLVGLFRCIDYTTQCPGAFIVFFTQSLFSSYSSDIILCITELFLLMRNTIRVKYDVNRKIARMQLMPGRYGVGLQYNRWCGFESRSDRAKFIFLFFFFLYVVSTENRSSSILNFFPSINDNFRSYCR